MAPDKKKAKLDRRRFLRNSGVVAGMAAMAPFASAIVQPGERALAVKTKADPSAFGPRDDTFKPAPQDDRKATPSAGPSMSRQFARWVAQLRYEDLPAPVVDRLKRFE